MSEFFDKGAELHAKAPELLLAQVWVASSPILDLAAAHEFVEGYKAARRRRDEFIAEGKAS